MNLTQEPQLRHEQTIWQTLDRVVELTYRERRLMKNIRKECDELRNVREERRRILRAKGIGQWRCQPSTYKIARIVACLMLLPMLAIAGPFDHLLTNKTAKAIAVAPVTYSATFGWGASTSQNVTNYSLFYGGRSGMYTNRVPVGNVTTATVQGFESGARYYAAVRSEASGTNSLFSNEINFTLGPTNPPVTNVVTITAEARDIAVPGAPWILIWSTQVTNPIGSQIFRLHAK